MRHTPGEGCSVPTMRTVTVYGTQLSDRLLVIERVQIEAPYF